MAFVVTITIQNAGAHTIWARLADKLGREPTNKEIVDECRRIIRDARS